MATSSLHFRLLILGNGYESQLLVSGIVKGFPQPNSHSVKEEVCLHHLQVDGEDVTLTMYINEIIEELDIHRDSAPYIYGDTNGMILL